MCLIWTCMIFMRGYNPGKLTVNTYDAHPNEFAHALASQAIAEFIEKKAIK